MKDFTGTQRQLLNDAAAQPNGRIELPPKRPAGVAGLVKLGFAIVSTDDEGLTTLKITAAGRVAIDETLTGKIGALIVLLRQPEGAGITDLMAATGWQAHSVRGAISGTIKKKLRLEVSSTKTETGRVYRIA